MIDNKFIEDNINTIILGDCLDVMKQIPDKSIDLVLTDPPYGINYDKSASKQSGKKLGNAATGKGEYKLTDWDNKLDSKYFKDIFRISKNQIIFGAEHLCLFFPQSRGWIVWNKFTGDNNFSDCELAWTSYDNPIRKYDFIWSGMIQQNMKNKEKRIHPTQKPIDLFGQLLRDYSKETDLILDCFSGSGTTAIACSKLNRNYICIEKDPDYHAASVKRLEDFKRQGVLF